MKNVFRVFLVVLLTVSLASGPVANACCNDFWSCAAALATGGLSCAVEDLINSITSMIHNIETIVSSVNRNVGEVTSAAFNAIRAAGDDLRGLAQTAENDGADALRRAQAIVAEAERLAVSAPVNPAFTSGAAQIKGDVTKEPAGAPTGGSNAGAPTGGSNAGAPTGGSNTGAPTGGSKAGAPVASAVVLTPCEPAAMLDSLRRAKMEIEKEKTKLAQHADSVRQSANRAQDQVRAKFDFAGQMAQDTLLGPLNDLGGMLNDLIRHPERLFNPASLVNETLTRVTNRIAQTMNDITDELVRDARATLDLAREPAHLAMDGAASAKLLAEMMDRLRQQKTKSACDNLNALLPKTNITLIAHMATVNPALGFTNHRTLASNALAKIGAGKTKSLAVSAGISSSLNRDWSLLKTKQQALSRPTLPPGAANSLKQHEDSMFRGLNSTQVQGKRSELIAEARRRFANDPKTLDKVLVYLNKTVDTRVKLAPALVR